MSKCTICSSRKGKRTCKATGGSVCSECCGTKRGTMPGCDDTCQWFTPPDYRRPSMAFPKMVNRDGDTMVFSRAAYGVRDFRKVARVLRAIDTLHVDLRADGTLAADWLDRPLTRKEKKASIVIGPALLGSITVSESELVLECNSKERLIEGVALVESACAAMLELPPEVSFKTPEEVASEPGDDEDDDLSPEIDREILKRFLDDHYEKQWVNSRLPALRGKTPLEASRTDSGREKLRALIEKIESRQHLADDALRYDFKKVRAILGLDE